MKAAVLHAKQDIRFEDYPDPTVDDDEVLIKVHLTGICGSDIPRVNGDAAHHYPIVLGHEFAGEVAGLGKAVQGLALGDRVTAAPLLPCLKCVDCQKGNLSQCKNYSFVGSRQQGSYAQFVKFPQRNVVKFSASVSWEQAAFFEPATVGLHGLRCINYHGGEEVAILGSGTIGLFTAQWARILGAKKVTVFDIDPVRLEVAKTMGADAVVDTRDADFLEKVLAATAGRGYGYVFETAGSDVTMKLAFELAANKAGVCFIGTPTRELTFTPHLFEKMNRKEFLLTGSWMSYSAPFPGVEWELTAHHFAKGELRYDESMIFARFPLAKADEAFRLFLTPGTVKGKILLQP